MHSGGISWSDLNPFNYETCIGDYCTDIDTIGEAAKEAAVTVGSGIADGAKTVYDFYAEKPAMLPAIVFGWPLMLFGGGCATTKKNEKPAPSVTLNFKESDNPLAYKLYQGLLKEGVKQGDIDKGYSIINFDGKYCPTHEEKSCIKGANDLAIESQEVFEYALNNYERFQRLIEITLGRPLPWVLDDLNPETTFDAEIRTKVTNAIDALKIILAKQGLSEKSETYKERMAVGLLWFAALPQSQIPTDAIIYPFMKERLEGVGLNEFVSYLAQNGGLRIKAEGVNEYTALEALQHENGDCSEFSKILFAILKMANLDPQFVAVQMKLTDANTMVGPIELINQSFTMEAQVQLRANPFLNHVCLGLPVGGHIRVLDSMFFQDDAKYETYSPISMRQFLSFVYSNKSMHLGASRTDEAKSNFTNAITLDPMNVMAYRNWGIAFLLSNSPDDSISLLTHALEIYPSFSMPYYERGIAWLLKGNSGNAIRDFSQYLKFGPEYVGSVSGSINLIITKKWQGKPEAAAFATDTPYDLTRVEILLLKTIISWNIGKKDEARTHLHIISDGFTVNKTPSDFTKQFFESMFQLMPADMREDEEVKGMITSIRTALQNAQ